MHVIIVSFLTEVKGNYFAKEEDYKLGLEGLVISKLRSVKLG